MCMFCVSTHTEVVFTTEPRECLEVYPKCVMRGG